MPLFFHLKNGGNGIYLTGLLWGLNELVVVLKNKYMVRVQELSAAIFVVLNP